MSDAVHDDMLFNMLEDCKTLPVFLDHIFGFLKRRSDFYVVAEKSDSPVGLTPGLAENLVRQSYGKYIDAIKSLKNPISGEINLESACTKPLTNNPVPSSRADPSKSYNGASFDNYSWSQSYNEVDVFLTLAHNITSRDIVVNTTSNKVCIKLTNGTILLQGILSQTCKLDPIWSIESNELSLHLEKSKEIWWDRFFTTEPKLDISKIECTKPIEELPDDAQAKIQELQFNLEQKRLGLPTSDEISSMNTLKRAWNAEGSPFSGPFDPSSVSFN